MIDRSNNEIREPSKYLRKERFLIEFEFEFEFEFDTIIHNNKEIICIMHQEYLYGLCSPSSSTPATEKKLGDNSILKLAYVITKFPSTPCYL